MSDDVCCMTNEILQFEFLRSFNDLKLLLS